MIEYRGARRSFVGRAIATLAACAILIGACGEDGASPDSDDGDRARVIQGATVSSDVVSLSYYGDLWANTWADDDRLYMSWGDGTGLSDCIPTYDGSTPGAWTDWDHEEVSPDCFRVTLPCDGCVMEALFCGLFDCGECYPLCPFTPAGLLALEGNVSAPSACNGDACVVARDLPTGNDTAARQRNDKPSSLLFLSGRLYLAGHYPSGSPTYGYVAVSDDYGATWSEVPRSPWTGSSPFRVMMFINMGRAYGLNTDGFVYGLGIAAELSESGPIPIYLARVPVASVALYERYEYFTGTADDPRWSSDPAGAVPLEGIQSCAQGGAIYHQAAERYLFLSGVDDWGTLNGALYEAAQPWGPWLKVATLPGGFIPSLIAKGAGTNHVYFTMAGGVKTYNLNIGRLDLVMSE